MLGVVTIGLRSQRWRLYTYSDGGSDGLIEPTYTFAREVWGRVERFGMSQRGREGGQQNEGTATLLVHGEVVVPSQGLVVSEDGTESYKIVGQARRRGLDAKMVPLVDASEDEFVKVES